MVRARAEAPVPANGPREHFLRGWLRVGASGELLARVAADQDSSLVKVMAGSNTLIRRPAGAAAAATGELVDVLPLAPVSRDANHVG